MKKTVLLFMSMAIFAACSNQTPDNETTTEVANLEEQSLIPVAVVNVDSILSQYTFAQESNEKLIKRQEDSRVKINSKARQLQNEMVDFQRKLENNAFLSRERAEQESRRLQQKEADLQQLDRQLSQDLMTEQQKLSIQLRDSINAAIKALNQDNKYHLVLSTNSLNDNILYSASEYDITDDVIKYLNANYKK
ncbi:MAG TPA: OmpH family outer membrane protein [Paludibacteraceae bacterium]|nr:OmpH family outer membrane protein [Paludibacteraceae bacterium]HQB68501.1 OmpH family outer membrane protein [Paludibacteraceae bacterium]HRS67002.1 OmpH family outer membrane protein [Paludibacteraceae bacterium]